ncbi:type VII secretion protein EccCa [Streptomyces sp. NBC_01136]|uniref:type VII secretion protein EccCa n=1 Tax=unclassified Streptomyces TaxID=2593676 RepID=UPI0032548BEB|nr:type VII secretion protein EccCa [Streptomyces sp. NBC_01136]
MSRIAWHRPARVHPPQLPDSRLTLAAPPQVQNSSSMSTWMTLLLPLLSSISIAAYMVTYRHTLTTVLAIVIVVLSVVLVVGARQQARAHQQRTLDKHRGRYLEHLAEVKEAGREVAAMQREVSLWQHPGPERLWAIAARRRRVWERRPGDPDFLRLRLGTGRGALVTPLQMSARTDPTVEYEPTSMAAAERVRSALGTVAHQPALVDVGRAGVVSILGPADRARAAARALVTQLAVLHAPEDVTLAVCTSGQSAQWAWTAWLPHTRDSTATGSAGAEPEQPEAEDGEPAPLVADSFDGLADVLERELARARTETAARPTALTGPGRGTGPSRRLLLVIDGYDPASAWGRSALGRQLVESAGPALGITLVALVAREADEPSRVDVRVHIDGSGSLTLESRDSALTTDVDDAVADQPDPALSEATARALTPLLLTEDEQQVLARTVPLSELLGITDLAGLDPTGLWAEPSDEAMLRVPLGTDAGGHDLVLDLKEAAQNGMGPHGLVVGATGSGKSELLRTLVTGLTTTHSPEHLSFVLVDFKGGASFAGFTQLPHVAGLITNLADDLGLVDRVRDALIGEQQRRQQMLRDAGNVDSLREYHIRQAAGGTDIHGRPLQPLPYLLVVVDEFGELLSARADFINLFVQIGRVGRSLGMHLLLATQRLEEGRLRGLESHLSYRICLRTFSAAESRAVIGTTDAYHLPSIPGSAYLKVGESVYTRFRVAHVSAPYENPADGPGEELQKAVPVELATLRRAPVPLATPEPDRTTGREATPKGLPGPTQMEVVVGRLRQFGNAVHQIWLPPLPPAVPLDALIGATAVQVGRGRQAVLWPDSGSLRVPVGVVDVPLSQRQEPLVLDFGQRHPHLALVGAPQSGKSTLLRTTLLSAMLTHTPDELQFACVDFGGGSLYALAGAPHVSAVAGRHEPAMVRRVLDDARRLIGEREHFIREHAVGSVAEFRARSRKGDFDAALRTADLIVVIDNWGAVRGEIDNADALVLDIAGRGPGAGVHLLITANRWGDVRMNLRDSISARLELRLNDSAESEVDRRLSKLVPAGVPGRGAVAPGHFFQAALPRMDGRESADGLAEAQEKMIAKVAAAWKGRPAPRVRTLPDLIRVGELPEPAGDGPAPGAVIGLDAADLEPVHLDLAGGDQHLLVVGDAGSGKSTFLRTWMRQMAAHRPPEELRFMVVDYRRALAGVVPAAYMGAYAAEARQTEAYAAQLAEVLTERLPGPDIDARRLRRRDWWTGPDLYLVVDDHDLVGGGRTTPLQPLLDLAVQSREIGFHIVLARRSGAISRALVSDPLVARVKELGAAGLILSSDPREGVIMGTRRAAELPPGRGVLVQRRAGETLIQVAVSDEEPDDADGDRSAG